MFTHVLHVHTPQVKVPWSLQLVWLVICVERDKILNQYISNELQFTGSMLNFSYYS